MFLLNESNTIIKVDRDGWELNRFELDSGDRGDAIVAGGKYVYVLDTKGKGILQYSNSGKRLNKISIKGTVDIDSDNEGSLYVINKKKTGICSVYNPLVTCMGSIDAEGAKGEKKVYDPSKIAVERDGRRVYLYGKNNCAEIKTKINMYEKSGGVGSLYPFLKAKNIENILLLKVNNYNRLMAVYESGKHTINLLNVDNVGNNVVEEKYLHLDVYNEIKDIEVDGVENIYVLDKASDVHIFKQQKLLKE